ncbi:MAG: rod shape-determining protein MreD, partial [Bryobacteraceae bacterium]
MSESFDSASLFARRRSGGRKLRPWLMVAIPVTAILFQVYAPLFVGLLSYLELPLLVTIYLAMNRRSPVAGLLVGAVIGLFQDALSHWPVGMLGRVKTLAGFAASSLGLRLNT